MSTNILKKLLNQEEIPQSRNVNISLGRPLRHWWYFVYCVVFVIETFRNNCTLLQPAHLASGLNLQGLLQHQSTKPDTYAKKEEKGGNSFLFQWLFKIQFFLLKWIFFLIRENMFWTRGGRCMYLVQTHKCSLLIMGPHIFQIKLCYSSVGAAWTEMQF